MAAYDHETNILFLHVPKTGGSSITHSFFNTFLTYNRHIDTLTAQKNIKSLSEVVHIPSELDKSIDDSFIFSTVRNPYERFFSFYLTHMIKKRRVCPKDFSKENFEKFIVYDWQPYIKSKYTLRKDSQDPQVVCRDPNFKSWVRKDKMVDHKVCENIYKKYYCLEADQPEIKIRFLLFDNIQQEYRAMLSYLLETSVVDFNEMDLERLEQSVNNKKVETKRTLGTRASLIHKTMANEGLHLVNIAPSRGSGKKVGRGTWLSKHSAADLYTDKARKIFERYNQEDIIFYNTLNRMSFKERFVTPHSYFNLVKDA